MEAKETLGKAQKRSLDEAITGLWKVIDKARGILERADLDPSEMRAWAKILGDTISILNKVVQTQRGEELGDEDIEEILKKVPEKYSKIVQNIFKKSIIGDKKAATPATSDDKSGVGDIYEQARTLKFGDSIHIWWIDASRSQNVDINKLPLPNHNVETRKENIPRIFVTVQKGDTWHDPHLICVVDRTDDHSFEIESIPLIFIKKIEKHIKAKVPFETRKPLQNSSIFKHLKNSRKRRKSAVRFGDGSTKILD